MRDNHYKKNSFYYDIHIQFIQQYLHYNKLLAYKTKYLHNSSFKFFIKLHINAKYRINMSERICKLRGDVAFRKLFLK